MRALVTGANGFLGTRVVSALLARGYHVRALMRPAAGEPSSGWQGRAEIVRADLRSPRELEKSFRGVDVLVHLAAQVKGAPEAQFLGTVVATEKLLDAMKRAGSTRRIVFASSFSVYDWTAAKNPFNEQTPLETKPYERDGYAIAKLWQERVVRRYAEENGWTLTVLRPGFIYGPGGPEVAGAGMRVGKIYWVVAPFARLPLTHVENTAAAFALAADKNLNDTFNIVDDERVTSSQYARRLLSKSLTMRVPMPYVAGLFLAGLAQTTSRLLFPPKGGKLPGIFIPRRYRARFRPMRFENRHAKEVLGWTSKPLFNQGPII